MDGIFVSDLFQTSAFSEGYNGKRAKGFFKLLVICACVLLEYLLNLVTPDYMLLIKGCIVYHDVFVDGAIVFHQVSQPSEFTV